MMGINAVKGVEIGDGFAVINQKGSEHRDRMTPEGFATNHAGGVLGGISTGQDVLVHMALKPTSSITVPGETITVDGKTTDLWHLWDMPMMMRQLGIMSEERPFVSQ